MYTPLERDIRGGQRGVDDPAKADNFGTFDLGAIEAGGGLPPFLFASGFESP